MGDVVAAVIPPPAPGTQALPPESVALAMTRQPRPRLRAGWKLAPVLAAGGGCGRRWRSQCSLRTGGR